MDVFGWRVNLDGMASFKFVGNGIAPFCVWKKERSRSIFYLVQESK
jgi:hypothetical protein